MATSDRTQWKQVVTGVLGALRTVANSFQAVAQDAQRFAETGVGSSAANATVNTNYALARVERPVTVKECRILPGGALTFASGNFVQINYGFTNDNGGAFTSLGGINTSNTAANGATGNWVGGTSILITANTSVNQTIPSGSFLMFTATYTGGAGVAIPAGTQFQMLWEEV